MRAWLLQRFHGQTRSLRYLMVGGVNTAFAFAVGGWMYLALHRLLPTPVIGVLANLVTISFSFFTLRTLVFRSQAPWWPEYLRCYAVYGVTAGITVLAQWAMVDGLGLGIWWTQAINIPLGVLLSYTAHARFTFARRPAGSQPQRPS